MEKCGKRVDSAQTRTRTFVRVGTKSLALWHAHAHHDSIDDANAHANSRTHYIHGCTPLGIPRLLRPARVLGERMELSVVVSKKQARGVIVTLASPPPLPLPGGGVTVSRAGVSPVLPVAIPAAPPPPWSPLPPAPIRSASRICCCSKWPTERLTRRDARGSITTVCSETASRRNAPSLSSCAGSSVRTRE
jgi:hypothetical protein